MRSERSFHVGRVLAACATTWAFHVLASVGFLGLPPFRPDLISGWAAANQKQKSFKCLRQAGELQVDPSAAITDGGSLPDQTEIDMDALAKKKSNPHAPDARLVLQIGQTVLGNITEILDTLVVLDLGVDSPGRLHWTAAVGHETFPPQLRQQFRVGETIPVKVMQAGAKWVRVTMRDSRVFHKRSHTHLKLGEEVKGRLVSETPELWLLDVGVGILAGLRKDLPDVPRELRVGQWMGVEVKEITKHQLFMAMPSRSLTNSTSYFRLHADAVAA
mmetsp:Transcript_36338/g.65978  ORF Transcript_36338/g.65978 Transcript_36338/m.65978 type:complete len:274 (-) Transcript_36338:143-964(-)|eukprot:CAMPEP_0197656076 /NCGR_PEP_ID=MMETSP1338-20131121/40108_1 /TAXON_ID=43686 ORGANISM="Pelagodinium beii, Strain RCC1491" /NCGR_SAMPLE_ID=MMETSP1338 /ASSEMBLY_ACC=CAM_ASM_000754 /LENGTH=273 /DNA_ID=CAMNT_0043231883 /DNA_START=95 /DNA_END=916 /DNA_ORIENTATION=+